MPLKLKITGGLIRCGRCGKRYTNPLTHVCVTRMDRKAAPRRTALKPKAGVTLATCGSCGKRYSNPLAHVCSVKTDFKARRKAAAKQAARKRPAKPAHNYRTCGDTDCTRVACEAYREGYEVGYEDGRTQ